MIIHFAIHQHVDQIRELGNSGRRFVIRDIIVSFCIICSCPAILKAHLGLRHLYQKFCNKIINILKRPNRWFLKTILLYSADMAGSLWLFLMFYTVQTASTWSLIWVYWCNKKIASSPEGISQKRFSGTYWRLEKTLAEEHCSRKRLLWRTRIKYWLINW